MSAGSSSHIRSIPLDIILTLLSCGLFNIYIQYRQMDAVNDMLDQEKYRFLSWFAFSILTCGLYHIYHEYRMAEDIADCSGRTNSSDGIIALILSLTGLSIVVDAIQQSNINAHYGSDAL